MDHGVIPLPQKRRTALVALGAVDEMDARPAGSAKTIFVFRQF